MNINRNIYLLFGTDNVCNIILGLTDYNQFRNEFLNYRNIPKFRKNK